MQNSEENNQNENKTPSKMARLAWPKAKYGVTVSYTHLRAHETG